MFSIKKSSICALLFACSLQALCAAPQEESFLKALNTAAKTCHRASLALGLVFGAMIGLGTQDVATSLGAASLVYIQTACASVLALSAVARARSKEPISWQDRERYNRFTRKQFVTAACLLAANTLLTPFVGAAIFG